MAKRIGAGLIACLLAAFFGFVGWHKTVDSLTDLARYGSWTVHLPEWLGRIVGVSELAAALALALGTFAPRLARLVRPGALYLVANQLVAAITHFTQGESAALPQNAVLIALSGLVAFLSKPRSQETA